MPISYLPVLAALGVALAIGVGFVFVSSLIGSRSGGTAKLSTYESGAPILDRSRKRISIRADFARALASSAQPDRDAATASYNPRLS